MVHFLTPGEGWFANHSLDTPLFHGTTVTTMPDAKPLKLVGC